MTDTAHSTDYTARYGPTKSFNKAAPLPNSAMDFGKMLFNRWGRFLPLGDLKQLFSEQPAFNGNDFAQGMRSAFRGGLSAWNNPKIKDSAWGLIRTLGASMILMYSVAFIGMLFFLPLLVFFPGWIFSILSLIPFWSYSIAKKRNPLFSSRLFLDELYRLNPSLADEIASQLPQSHKQTFDSQWVRSLSTDLRTSWHFAKLSAFFLAISAIPIVGPLVSFVGQYYLMADKLGWEFMNIYTQAAKRMDYKQTKEWIRAKKWEVIGFSLPWALVSSIPFGGPLLLSYGQAAAAHLFVDLFSGQQRQQSMAMNQG